MTDSSPYRVRYYAGQTLRRQDFEDEQAYHIAQLIAHNKHQHRPGVVGGLNICFDADEKRFKVESGEAIGKDGAFVVLEQTWPIEISVFDEEGEDQLDVFLEHSDPNDERESLPPQYMSCRTSPGDGLGRQALEARVVIEETRPRPQEDDRIYLGRIIRDFSSAEVAYKKDIQTRENAGLVGAVIDSPSGVARLELGTYKTALDRRFALFLLDPTEDDSDSITSSAARSQDIDNKESPAFEIRGVGEQCAIDLRGKTTVTGDIFVRQGALAFDECTDSTTNLLNWLVQSLRTRVHFRIKDLLPIVRHVFELVSEAESNSNGEGTGQTSDSQTKVPEYEWLNNFLTKNADRTVGDLFHMILANLPELLARIEGWADAVKAEKKEKVFSAAKSGDSLPPLPTPWTIYRAGCASGSPKDSQEVSTQVPVEQLRVELDGTRESEFVVGSRTADGESFEPILTVASKPAVGEGSLGKVVVKGDLIVQGRIEGKCEEPSLSDQARELLFSGALLGPQNAEALINAFEGTGFLTQVQAIVNLKPETPAKELQPFVEAVLRGKDNGLEAVSNAIGSDAVPPDTAAPNLQPLMAAVLGKTEGLASVADGVGSDAVAADTEAEDLQPLVAAVLGKNEGLASVANGVGSDAVDENVSANALKPIAQALLNKNNGAEAVVSTSDRRRAVIRGLVNRFVVSEPAAVPPNTGVNPLADEIVDEDNTFDKRWAASLRDELTHVLQ